jgi:hypothetical protein
MPDVSEPEPWRKPVPLWSLLDEATRKKLIKFQRRKYHTELNPPFEPADIIKFDPTVEMVKKPNYERESMR